MQLFESYPAQHYYFVLGLRRSGNHVLVSWIISNFKKVLFVNDVNRTPILDEKSHTKEFWDHLIAREHNKFPNSLNGNLLSRKEVLDKSVKPDCLIFSMEDKRVENFLHVVSHFKISTKASHKKIIVLRDPLNCFASRLQASAVLPKGHHEIKNFKVDEYTVKLWKEYDADSECIHFNYNTFLLGDYHQYKNLGLQGPPSKNVLEGVPDFGRGSSFDQGHKKTKVGTNKYFTRYKTFVRQSPILRSLLKDKHVMARLQTDYGFYPKKIAFLFLTKVGVNYPDLWQQYFAQTDERQYNIYVHPKYPDRVTDFLLQPYVIKDLRPTEWGFIIGAYRALVRAALKDDPLNKYFMIVSESDIPIRPFHEFYNAATTNMLELWPVTSYDKQARLGHVVDKVKPKEIIKHSAFWVLKRNTIKKLFSDPRLKLFENAPSGEEFFLSLVYNQNFVNRVVTYADWEDSRKKYRKYKTAEKEYKTKGNVEMANKYRKMAEDVNAHPKTFHTLPTKEFIDTNMKGAFFARKFSET